MPPKGARSVSLNARHRNFGQVRTWQARGQRQSLPRAGPLSPGSRGGGGAKRRDLGRTRSPKPGCRGREQSLRIEKKKLGAGEATGEEEEEEAKKKGLGNRVLWGTQPATPGLGVSNKAAASGQKCSGCFRRGALRGGPGWLGMPGAPAPWARSRAPLTFAGAAGAHFRGLRSGRAGPSRGTRSRSPRGGSGKAAPGTWAGADALERNPSGGAAGAGAGRGVLASALTGCRTEPRRRWRSPSQWEEKVVSFPSVSPLLHPLGSGPALPLPRPLPQARGPCGRWKDAET